MIFDKIENAHLYAKTHAGINKALNYLKNTNFLELENGKHEIEGDVIFAIVNEYETKKPEENLLESHIKYIDVQFVAQGIEQIGFTTFNNQKPVKLYDSPDDYMLFKEPYNLITLNKGMFAIFYPDDMHIPGLMIDTVSKVKKVVVKVKI
jgi:YhcH/YjgK/YiaL family protein